MLAFKTPIPQSSRAFQEQIRPLWEGFLAGGDPAELHDRIQDSIVRSCGHSHPWRHRIGDVVLEGQAYRVGRCARCAEELSFEPIDRAHEEPGVPTHSPALRCARGRRKRRFALRSALST